MEALQPEINNESPPTPRNKRGRKPTQPVTENQTGGVDVANAPGSSLPTDQSLGEGVCVTYDPGNATTKVGYKNQLGHVMAIPDRDGCQATPSVVGFQGGDPNKFIVGRPAANLERSEPEYTCSMMKRARGTITDVPGIMDNTGRVWMTSELESMLAADRLKHAQEVIGAPISRVLVCCPAHFNDAQRRASLDIVEKAGFRTVGVINEPSAALLAYGTETRGVKMVVDIGGGTTDITIMNCTGDNEVCVLATAGSESLGGHELTGRIYDMCIDFAKAQGFTLDPQKDYRCSVRLREEAEAAKKDLSTVDSVTLTFRVQNQLLDFTLTRAQFEDVVSDLCDRITNLVHDALGKANVQPTDVQSVVLAGGSSRTRCIQNRIASIFGAEKLRWDIDVDTAVVCGAVRAIGLKLQERIAAGDVALKNEVNAFYLKPDVKLVDILGLDLGVRAVETVSGKEVLVPIIKQGSCLPAEAMQVFGLIGGGQAGGTTNVTVLQGRAFEDADNARVLETFPLDNLPAGPEKDRIAIYLQIDTNGTVNVKCVDLHTGREITAQFNAREAVVQQSVA
jgi:molecular chaperone DnaK